MVNEDGTSVDYDDTVMVYTALSRKLFEQKRAGGKRPLRIPAMTQLSAEDVSRARSTVSHVREK